MKKNWQLLYRVSEIHVMLLLFYVHVAISEHGKNIEALSQALPGKSSAQCRNFFTNYKHKLNLPRLIAEYELKHVRIACCM